MTTSFELSKALKTPKKPRRKIKLNPAYVRYNPKTSILGVTRSCTDVRIVDMCYRKWYNPLRYILGKRIKNQCIVVFE